MIDPGRRVARLNDPIRVRWTEERATRVARAFRLRLRRSAMLRIFTLTLVGASALGATTWLLLFRRPLAPHPSPMVLAQARQVQSPPLPGEQAPAGPVEQKVWRLSDGSRIESGSEETQVRVEDEAGRPTVVYLDRGSARFMVAPRNGRPFRVIAGPLLAEVLGTVFVVRHQGTAVRVTVERGRVRTSWPGGTRDLSGGQDGLFPISALPAGGADALLHEADAARLRGQPERALSALTRFVREHHGDARVGLAAFTRGRLLLQLGRPGDAALALAQVQDLVRAGPLREDALAREVEAWDRAGEPERARTQAQEYLRLYPEGARVWLVRRHGHLP